VATARDAGDGLTVGRQVSCADIWTRGRKLYRTQSTTSSQCSYIPLPL